MASNLADVCGSGRDGVGVSSTGGVNSGDWICGDVTCSHSNFARRQQCKKCKRDRSSERSSSVGSSGSNKKKLGTEIGKAAAEKSRGLFSAEDWQCNKCANVNWARRMTCNMCNAPKFCDVEERTGFGGGYNDRGVVEYKERPESDSEYDEFGRLKKRKKNSYDSDRIKSSKIVNTIEEEEEDDEDEDGDDHDLAKYNLFSDDEEIVPSVKKVEENNIKSDIKTSLNEKAKSTDRRSRSRTRSDFRRRQSNSSSEGSSFSSTSSSTSSSSSSSSSTSSSSSETLSQHSRSRELQQRTKKHSYSHSRSRSRPSSLPKRKRSSSHKRHSRKRSHDKKLNTSERRTSYSSRSKSRSSHHSSRSPPSKRKHSRSSSLSRKHSCSPRSNKRTTRSRSATPKRRR